MAAYNIELDAAFYYNYMHMRASQERKFLSSSRREPAFIGKGLLMILSLLLIFCSFFCVFKFLLVFLISFHSSP